MSCVISFGPFMGTPGEKFETEHSRLLPHGSHFSTHSHRCASFGTEWLLYLVQQPIPVAALPEAWVCVRWLAGIAGLDPAGGMDVYVWLVLCVGR